MCSVIIKYADLANTWEANVKAAEDQAASSDHYHVEAKANLQEEVTALRSQVKEKEEALVQECARVAEVVAKLDHYEVLCQLAESRALANKDDTTMVEGRAKATEEQARATDEQAKATTEEAKSAATQVIEEYKDSDTFNADATTTTMGI